MWEDIAKTFLVFLGFGFIALVLVGISEVFTDHEDPPNIHTP